jgi:hypothetical protein
MSFYLQLLMFNKTNITKKMPNRKENIFDQPYLMATLKLIDFSITQLVNLRWVHVIVVDVWCQSDNLYDVSVNVIINLYFT